MTWEYIGINFRERFDIEYHNEMKKYLLYDKKMNIYISNVDILYSSPDNAYEILQNYITNERNNKINQILLD